MPSACAEQETRLRYTDEALALLTGRHRAYGYWHTERFLTHLALRGGAEVLTNALGKWSAALWQSGAEQEVAGCFYVDGHRKPVYADKLIPRGLIGCSGKILGCRALVLLHDDQGYPREASTHRGDQLMRSKGKQHPCEWWWIVKAWLLLSSAT